MEVLKTMTAREILVTHALPYANGPLHIGHLLGYIQTDIWVRARRMAGDTVHFVAADDVHGTPIMLAAEKAGTSPEEFIKGMQISHEADFRDFGVAHDYYYTTHSPENRELAEMVYARLRDAQPSHIAKRSIRQLFDPVKQMFLPDRYIKGICPNCGTPDQYGDNCENCGATYSPTACAIGIFRATRRISVSRFPMRPASFSMSGSMRRSAISPRSRNTARANKAPSMV